MENIVTIVLAFISSGAAVSLITRFFDRRKSNTEVEQLRQQIAEAETDNKIKVNDYLKKQLMEITETYREEAEDRRKEISELRQQNEELQKQISTLTKQIDQVMSWISYDVFGYQKWLERELKSAKPDIQLPKYRNPPKFVEAYLQTDVQSEQSET
jgi:chromosome segregation ATPase